mmetsp:Transcript_9359/g.23607  ORF Transcript_9359/g.23607 Transcript_9359/m.23607 type:complete len:220 (+) Transcript_9359:1239-1898(+)
MHLRLVSGARQLSSPRKSIRASCRSGQAIKRALLLSATRDPERRASRDKRRHGSLLRRGLGALGRDSWLALDAQSLPCPRRIDHGHLYWWRVARARHGNAWFVRFPSDGVQLCVLRDYRGAWLAPGAGALHRTRDHRHYRACVAHMFQPGQLHGPCVIPDHLSMRILGELGRSWEAEDRLASNSLGYVGLYRSLTDVFASSVPHAPIFTLVCGGASARH